MNSNNKPELYKGLNRKVTTFLLSISEDPNLMTLLNTKGGFTKDDADYGWSLAQRIRNAMTTMVESSPVKRAVQSLEEWQTTTFVRAQAVLDGNHPDQSAFVFNGLTREEGGEAITVVATFLARLDELQKGSERKATRKADHAALATLAKRGIGDAEIERVQAFLDIARTPTVQSTPREATVQLEKDQAELLRWYEEWKRIARVVVGRRRDLIRLGIAKRRAKKKVVAMPPATPVTPATPVATPAEPTVPALPVGSSANDDDEELAPPSRAA